MAQPENPFAPPSQSSEPPPAATSPTNLLTRKRRTPLVSLALWSFVCTVSAGPSFFWGMSTIARDQLWAMLLGVGIFIALYTWADQATQSRSWRHVFPVPLTLKIGYVTRIVISIIFPIGIFLDLFCGFLSVGIVQAILPSLRSTSSDSGGLESSAGFFGALIITLVQGVVLNIVLLGYASIVFGIIMAISARRH